MICAAQKRPMCPRLAGALVLLFVGWAPASRAACRYADVAVRPTVASPTEFDQLGFEVSGTSDGECVPVFSSFRFHIPTIEIHAGVPPGDCAPIVGPFSFETSELNLTVGTYQLELVLEDEVPDCSYPTTELVVTGGPAPVTGAGATLLYPYFEVDLAGGATRNTLIAVGNAAADPTVAHLTLWTDWGIPTYGFDLFLPGNGLQTYNLRQLFLGSLPETGGEGGAAFGCDAPVAVPPLAGEVAAELRRQHSGRPSAVTGLCAGSGRRGPDVVTGFLTVDVLDRCSGGGLVTPRDVLYFDNAGLLPPGPPLASNRNVLWGDLLFADVAGDNVQSLEAVAIPADAERWSAVGASFYRSLAGDGVLDHRAPLASAWKGRFLRGGAFAPSSRALLWIESDLRGFSPFEPIPCGQRSTVVDHCQEAAVQIYDEAGQEVENRILHGVEQVTGLYPVGSGELATEVPFGTVQLSNLFIEACPLIPTGVFPLQAYLAVLTEAEGRLSFAFRGTPLR